MADQFNQQDFADLLEFKSKLPKDHWAQPQIDNALQQMGRQINNRPIPTLKTVDTKPGALGDQSILGPTVGAAAKVSNAIELPSQKLGELSDAAKARLAPLPTEGQGAATTAIKGATTAITGMGMDTLKMGGQLLADPKNWPFLLAGSPELSGAVRPALKAAGTALFTALQGQGAVSEFLKKNYSSAAVQAGFGILSSIGLPGELADMLHPHVAAAARDAAAQRPVGAGGPAESGAAPTQPAGQPKAVIARHGETPLDKGPAGAETIAGMKGVAEGAGIDQEGIAQMHRLADQLEGKPISHVVTSEVDRAVQSGKILADRLGVPHTVDPRLNPVDRPTYEGMRSSEVAKDIQFYKDHPDLQFPGGESFNEMAVRQREGIDHHIKQAGEGRFPVIVTHSVNHEGLDLSLGGDKFKESPAPGGAVELRDKQFDEVNQSKIAAAGPRRVQVEATPIDKPKPPVRTDLIEEARAAYKSAHEERLELEGILSRKQRTGEALEATRDRVNKLLDYEKAATQKLAKHMPLDQLNSHLADIESGAKTRLEFVNKVLGAFEDIRQQRTQMAGDEPKAKDARAKGIDQGPLNAVLGRDREAKIPGLRKGDIPEGKRPEEVGWLLTNPTALRNFVGKVIGPHVVDAMQRMQFSDELVKAKGLSRSSTRLELDNKMQGVREYLTGQKTAGQLPAPGPKEQFREEGRPSNVEPPAIAQPEVPQPLPRKQTQKPLMSRAKMAETAAPAPRTGALVEGVEYQSPAQAKLSGDSAFGEGNYDVTSKTTVSGKTVYKIKAKEAAREAAKAPIAPGQGFSREEGVAGDAAVINRPAHAQEHSKQITQAVKDNLKGANAKTRMEVNSFLQKHYREIAAKEGGDSALAKTLQVLRDLKGEDSGQGLSPEKSGGSASSQRGSLSFKPLKAKVQSLLAANATLSPKQIARAIGREKLGYMHQEFEREAEYFSKDEARHGGTGGKSLDDLLHFSDAVETGDFSSLSPEDAKVAKLLKTMSDQKFSQIMDLKGIDHWFENYFPHMFTDPAKAGPIIQRLLAARRPLAGRAGFMRQRQLEGTLREVLDQRPDLTPATFNPIEMWRTRLHEMDKYLMAHQWKDELREEGLIQFFKPNSSMRNIPEGWQRLDDKIFQPMYRTDTGELVKAGEYWAQPEVAKTINNYLSPGLRGYKPYDYLRQVGNFLNMAQLSMTGFHAGFVSVVSSVSDLALATEKAFSGDFKGAVAPTLRSMSVLGSAIQDYRLGTQLQKERLNPGTYPHLSKVADAFARSDSRFTLDPQWQNAATKQFKMAMAERSWTTPFKGLHALIEQMSRPIMQYYVPRVKAGAFAKLAEFKLQQLSDAGMTDRNYINHELDKISDSMDNRFGQMVYDNRFWNKTAKDLSFLAFRAVGWNFGDLSELPGGLADMGKMAKEWSMGRKGEFSHKAAFLFALPIVTGTLGAMYQIGMTGQAPQDTIDYFYPRTGKLMPNGGPERVSLPTYMKDVFAFYKSPAQTAVHKLHPLIGMAYDMYQNRDYYGTEIRHPDDPKVIQAAQMAKFALEDFIPLSIKNFQQRLKADANPLDAASSSIGIVPAPRAVGQSKAERRALTYVEQTFPARTQAEATRREFVNQTRNRYNTGRLTEDQVGDLFDSGKLSANEFRSIINEKKQSPLERAFSRVSPEEAVHVWDDATPAEKEKLYPQFLHKYGNLPKTVPGSDQDRYIQLFEQRLDAYENQPPK